MGFLFGEEVDNDYRPSLIYRLFRPRNVTGNEINGLGETEVRSPTPIYHWFGKLKVPFNRVWWLLIVYGKLRGTKNHEKFLIKSYEYSGKPNHPVASKQVSKSPEQWTTDIKSYARQHGADLVGIMKMRDEWIFDGFEVKEKWIVILGLKMNYDTLKELPKPHGQDAVMETYADGAVLAWEMVNWLHDTGWPAKGACGPMASPVSMVPVALAAGFGELGKHGSIINRELGSNLRLAYVVTDIPLVEDTEDEFGADLFCTGCQICNKNCPPNAITNEKQMVRGVEKWYVDFDKCVPYFNDHGGCGVCLAVCPWTRPEVRPKLLTKMLKRKAKLEDKAAS